MEDVDGIGLGLNEDGGGGGVEDVCLHLHHLANLQWLQKVNTLNASQCREDPHILLWLDGGRR